MLELVDRLLATLSVRLHTFSVCEIQRGWRLRVGACDAVILHYVVKGTGSVRSGAGQWLAFAPHTLMVVPPGISHDLGEADCVVAESHADDHCSVLDDGLLKFTAGTGPRDTVLVCARISASYPGRVGLFPTLGEPLVRDLSTSDALRATLDLILTEVASPGFGTHAMAEVLIKRCLILLLREQAQNKRVNSQLSRFGGDQRLDRAVADVLVDPSAVHTMVTLAQKAGMSRASFADHFKKTYGQTPMNFVKTVRLETAATLLTTSDAPMKVISSAVGYTSRSSFSRAFRDLYGVDPRTYRLPMPGRSGS